MVLHSFDNWFLGKEKGRQLCNSAWRPGHNPLFRFLFFCRFSSDQLFSKFPISSSQNWF